MKKLFSILSILLLTVSLNAQIVSTMVKSAVTMTNSTAVTATLQANGCAENISIQIVVVKASGTVAGTVQVSASLDNVNFIALTTSSLSLTDVATNTAIFPLTDNKYLYYKVTFTGAGTMSATPNAYLFSSGLSNKHAVSNMLNGAASTQTTTNTGNSALDLGVVSWYDNISIQSVVTKVSGTVAGTVILQGSLDGTNFVAVNSSYADVVSYSPTDVATSTKIFVVTGAPYRYYRLYYVGAGTMVATQKGYLLPNKK
jgi:hypothetical protein